MARYSVNDAGVTNAARLIDAGEVDESTDWSDGQPSADEENEYIDAHGFDAYAEWHLAVDPDASEETKGRYAFPFGDFVRLNRGGLTSAKQRAAQYEHTAIAKAADDLLRRLDDRPQS